MTSRRVKGGLEKKEAALGKERREAALGRNRSHDPHCIPSFLVQFLLAKQRARESVFLGSLRFRTRIRNCFDEFEGIEFQRERERERCGSGKVGYE